MLYILFSIRMPAKSKRKCQLEGARAAKLQKLVSQSTHSLVVEETPTFNDYESEDDVDYDLKDDQIDEDQAITLHAKEWVQCFHRDDVMSLTLLRHHLFVSRIHVQVSNASKLIGEMVVKSDWTVREWRATFLTNNNSFPDTLQGNYRRRVVHGMDICDIDGFDLKEHIEKLNSDQLRAFEKISGHLYHQWQHKHGLCHCNDFKLLHTFISGVGGIGKSFLLQIIRRQVAEIWKDDATGDTKCVVATSTGMASYSISGVTVYRLFLLLTEYEGETAGYWPLSKLSQKTRCNNLCSLKFVIFDEVSMLSNLHLAYIDL